MKTLTILILLLLSSMVFANPLERFTPETIVGSVALKDKLVGTIWVYKWRDREYRFGFNSDGTISELKSWSMVKWVVIAPNEVELVGTSNRMVLIFNHKITAFNTIDWDGQKSSGTFFSR